MSKYEPKSNSKDQSESQVNSERIHQQLYLGFQYCQSGQFKEAETCFQEVLKLQPNNPDAWHLLGVIAAQQNQYSSAIEKIEYAIKQKPFEASFYKTLGLVFQELGTLEEAIRYYQKALQIKPDYFQVHNNLGNIFQEQGKLEKAINSYQRVLQIQPNYYQAHNNLGNILQKQGRLEEAINSYQRALQIQPNYYEAHNNLGNTLQEQDKLEEAINSYQRALQVKPDYVDAFNQYVHIRKLQCDWEGIETFEQSLVLAAKSEELVLPPFSALTLIDEPEIHLSAAKSYYQKKVGNSFPPLWKGERYNHDKIRIAYLSANYHQHAVAYLIAELFELHDRLRIELFAISFGPEDDSLMRQRLVKAFDEFIDVRQMSHFEAAQQIRNLEIDIAVDLTGYTKDFRPEILAYRPAPIQVNYLGYPGTMGSELIDYILVDPFIVPRDQQIYFTEKLVHLPDCYQVNDSKRIIDDYIPSRQECNLPEQGFVFCNFNNSYKINRQFFNVWMQLLKSVPDSVLWLLSKNESMEDNLRREAETRGVNSARLVFASKQKLPQDLARQQLADLFLDNLPYNAHTTASDALWVGLPVLTYVGKSFPARVAGSLLYNIGLPELVTDNLADYKALALKLATEPNFLSQIREKLKQNRLNTPLFDCNRFCQHLEAAYTQMWLTWQQGEKPQSFTVTPVNRATES